MRTDHILWYSRCRASMCKKIGIPLMGVLLLIGACKDQKPVEKVNLMDHTLLDSIYVKCPEVKKKPLTIYYLDGDCPSCISKAKTLETQHQNQTIDRKLVLMAITQNINMLTYNLKSSNITSCILIVKPEQLTAQIPLHSVTTIDPTGKILKQIEHY